jgi:hypothetical protein
MSKFVKMAAATKRPAKKSKAEKVREIADVTGYSVSHVANVLAGRRNNAEILKVAKRMRF